MKADLKILDFSKKVVIVTGGGTGIGEAVAHKFARLGARVMCAGLPGDPLADVVQAIRRAGGKADHFEGDLGDPMNAQALIDRAVQLWKRVDVVINNAGVVLYSGETQDAPDEVFERTVHANIFTTFYVSRAALPELKKTQGVLLACSSVAGLKGEPGNSVYGGTKGFVNAFMQGLATEQAKNGIRVNCVLPGVTDTAMTRSARTAISKSDEKGMTDEIPMQRKATVEEIANAFVFLASDMASYMTGVLLPVDGGYAVSWGGVEDVPARYKKAPKGQLKSVLKHTLQGGFKKNNPEPTPEPKHS